MPLNSLSFPSCDFVSHRENAAMFPLGPTGKLAKTDAIDAGVLAHFAEALRPEPRPLPDEDAQKLEALVTRRCQLVEMRVAEQNRLSSSRSPASERISPSTSAGSRPSSAS